MNENENKMCEAQWLTKIPQPIVEEPSDEIFSRINDAMLRLQAIISGMQDKLTDAANNMKVKDKTDEPEVKLSIKEIPVNSD